MMMILIKKMIFYPLFVDGGHDPVDGLSCRLDK